MYVYHYHATCARCIGQSSIDGIVESLMPITGSNYEHIKHEIVASRGILGATGDDLCIKSLSLLHTTDGE